MLLNKQEGVVMILREIKEGQIQAVSSKKISDAHIHHYNSWSNLFWQWFRYCLVGGANTLIDVLVLNILLLRFPTTQVQVLVIYNSLAYIAERRPHSSQGKGASGEREHHQRECIGDSPSL